MATFYKSNDPGSTGNVSSGIITILDACLVNGYGSKAAAGWTKHAVGVGIAVYEPAGASPKKCIRVDESGSDIRVRGFSSVADAVGNVTADGFPAGSQVGGGGLVAWSNAVGSRWWWLAADERAFYMSAQTDGSFSSIPPDTNNVYMGALGFGQFNSYVVGDTHNWFIMCGNSLQTTGSLQSFSTSGHYTARNALGDLPPPSFAKHFMGQKDSVGRGSAYSYPDVHTGRVRLQSRVRLLESVGGSILWRGELPGLAFPISNVEGRYFQVLAGTDDLAGREWMVVPVRPVSGFIDVPLWCIDLGNWRA